MINTPTKKLRVFGTFTLSFIGHGLALAQQGQGQATITYAPFSSSSIPTLSEWGQLGLVLLLAVMAYRYLRRTNGQWPIASLVLAGAAGVVTLSGANFSNSALAVAPGFSNPAGESLPICVGGGLPVTLTNTSGVAIVITGVTYDAGSTPANNNTCSQGFTMQPSVTCELSLTVTQSSVACAF